LQAIDTNVLIYAEITSSQYHLQARQVLTELAEGAPHGRCHGHVSMNFYAWSLIREFFIRRYLWKLR
jgi:hypothetical protein